MLNDSPIPPHPQRDLGGAGHFHAPISAALIDSTRISSVRRAL